MNRSHLEIREELTLWAMGITPDTPPPVLVEHLASCPECRRVLHETYELAGLLAYGTRPLRPPDDLWAKILAQVRADGPIGHVDRTGGGTEADDVFFESHAGAGNHVFDSERRERPAAESRPDARPRPLGGVSKHLRSWIAGGVAAALVLSLAAGNVSLSRRVERQEERLAEWEARYEADFRWLRSAEYLLVQQIGPALAAELVPSGGRASEAPGTWSGGRPGAPTVEQPGGFSAWGKATLYEAYDNRVYLIVWATGLSPAQSYEVWAAGEGEGEGRFLGPMPVSEQGSGSLAYPAGSREPWQVIELRTAAGDPVLRGELHPPSSKGPAW